MDKIKVKIKFVEPILKEKFRVKKIGIFGSYSRGEQKKGSDIDILVEYYDDPSLFEFFALKRFLAEKLGLKVDLVMKNSLKPYISKHILKEVIYI